MKTIANYRILFAVCLGLAIIGGLLYWILPLAQGDVRPNYYVLSFFGICCIGFISALAICNKAEKLILLSTADSSQFRTLVNQYGYGKHDEEIIEAFEIRIRRIFELVICSPTTGMTYMNIKAALQKVDKQSGYEPQKPYYRSLLIKALYSYGIIPLARVYVEAMSIEKEDVLKNEKGVGYLIMEALVRWPRSKRKETTLFCRFIELIKKRIKSIEEPRQSLLFANIPTLNNIIEFNEKFGDIVDVTNNRTYE